jgi:hypothetical protein
VLDDLRVEVAELGVPVGVLAALANAAFRAAVLTPSG